VCGGTGPAAGARPPLAADRTGRRVRLACRAAYGCELGLPVGCGVGWEAGGPVGWEEGGPAGWPDDGPGWGRAAQ